MFGNKENNKSKEKKKTLKVRFLLSPSGRFLLPYSEGGVADLPEALALELIETKYAEKVE